ncbi:MAG: SDR family oxidoreductase [Kiritimatiellae bacterium]|nr:SDR family oxidoreductase [Verrucomicrobiota bacterium]MCG2660645.1 SDR family oxidoreductase [Kiritimatiellia bacterium]
MKLMNKVAAITGAGRGIGRAAAERFAREGARVVILEKDEALGREVEDAIIRSGGQARYISLDISEPQAVEAGFARIAEEFGALHVLYNNASVFLGGRDAPVVDLEVEVWRQVLAINLFGLFYCCKHGIPLIIRSGGGSVINTSSSAGLIGIPNCDAYTASKGATIAMTRSMAVEYAPSKVRVNCIAPAAIRTAMVQQSNFSNPSFDETAFLRTTPVRRWGTPEEIANIALFLASDDSSYLNGTIIVADGGITIT